MVQGSGASAGAGLGSNYYPQVSKISPSRYPFPSPSLSPCLCPLLSSSHSLCPITIQSKKTPWQKICSLLLEVILNTLNLYLIRLSAFYIINSNSSNSYIFKYQCLQAVAGTR